MTTTLLSKEGYLEKRGHVVRNWKKRYFYLDNLQTLYYYESEEAKKAGNKAKGSVDCSKCYINTDDLIQRPHSFEVRISKDPSNSTSVYSLALAASSLAEKAAWVQAISKGRIILASAPPTTTSSASSSSSSLPVPTTTSSDNSFNTEQCVECLCTLGEPDKITTAFGKTYHKKCLVCPNCNKTITSDIASTTQVFNAKVYHKMCLRCDICHRSPLTGDAALVKGLKVCGGECSLKARATVSNPTLCGCCKKQIGNDKGVIISGGKTVHSYCFKCKECGKILSDSTTATVANNNTYNMYKDELYCPADYQRITTATLPKCEKCGKPIVDTFVSVKIKAKDDRERMLHPECHTCEKCRKTLKAGVPYFISGPFVYCNVCHVQPH